MARILGQLTKTATGTNPAIGDARVLGQVGQNPTTPKTAPAQPNTWGQAARNVFNGITSSEQNVGSIIGQSAALNSKDYSNAQTAHYGVNDQIFKTEQTIKQMKAQGQNTSHLEAILARVKQSEGLNNPTQANIAPATTQSTASALSSVAGVGIDLLSGGTYGTATKGMTTGKLALNAAKPTVIAAGEKGLKAGGEAVGDLTKKSVLGKDAIKTLGQIGDSEAQKFAKGKTFSEVVNGTQKAIDEFVSKSKTSLQKVKEAIPHIQVDPKKVIDKLNEGIMSSIENSQVYKGMEKDATLFKNPTELINSGLMNADEAKKVQGIVGAVKNWKDTSARGILNLKEKLAPFYKEGLDNSNRVLSRVQNGLKDLVGEVYPEIKPALAKASSDIDKAEEFSRNLIGRDTISGESKLQSIAKNLKNPAANAEKIGLLNDLKKFTGHDVIPELKGYANYLELLDKDFPSKIGTIAKAASIRLGITGGIVAGLGELKNITGL